MSQRHDRNPRTGRQYTLFELPLEPAAQTPELDPAPAPDLEPRQGRGRPRVRSANRQQIVYRALPLDALLPDDHPARAVWDFVERLDLGPLYDAIQSVQGRAGRAPIDPRILVALWLYATIEGVSSARHLDRLCRDHVAFQWLAGDVSTNYHTLADFRVQHVAVLNLLLTQSLAVLITEGLVDLNCVAQDGMRVRASAGAASFRRRPTLEQALTEARQQVEALDREAAEDPAGDDRRQTGARQRAARERVEAVERAIERLPELEARKRPDEREQARCSTTDPEATVMKMADGGFRPADNLQFATDVGSLVIVGVAVATAGSDAGLLSPMVDQVKDRTGIVPPGWLVDGGYPQHDQIDAVSMPGRGCTVYAPVPAPKDPQVDRYEPKPGDSVAVAAWRSRMATESAQERYKWRAATAECVNAQARGRGLVRLLVRGRAKVQAVALWHALAHNLLSGARLRAAAAQAA